MPRNVRSRFLRIPWNLAVSFFDFGSTEEIILRFIHLLTFLHRQKLFRRIILFRIKRIEITRNLLKFLLEEFLKPIFECLILKTSLLIIIFHRYSLLFHVNNPCNDQFSRKPAVGPVPPTGFRDSQTLIKTVVRVALRVLKVTVDFSFLYSTSFLPPARSLYPLYFARPVFLVDINHEWCRVAYPCAPKSGGERPGVDLVSRSLVQAWSKEWQARVAFLDKGKISTLQIKRTTRPSGSFLSHKFHG